MVNILFESDATPAPCISPSIGDSRLPSAGIERPTPGQGEIRELEIVSDMDVAVRPWRDNFVDRSGHDPRSKYVEMYWLGTLGPSSVWLMRRLVTELDSNPDGFVFDAQEWAKWLGVGCSGGRNSRFARVVRRCVDFGAVRTPPPTGKKVRFE
ncbi:MAG TPA: hypothetical protein VMU77_04095, partial [Acidimicrobiales bacterium]|nr:hypothetical protein [Acidimicrobiales bacterium]